MRREAAVRSVPSVTPQAGVGRIVSVTEPRRRAGARGAFPLRLRRESIMAASRNAPCREFLLRQLRAIVRCIRPANAGNRTAHITREGAWVRAHNRQVLALRHFILPDPKAAGEYHCGLRTFVAGAIQFVGRAAHRESIGRDEDHVRGRALPERSVKLLRREMGRHIREDDSA